MKIVVNGAFGGYGLGVDKELKSLINKYEGGDRTNPELVACVENNPNRCGDLEIIEIPDNATDWDINEYDGLETVIYVVDGKIRYAE
jgi:hypothetical protein